MHHLVKIKQNSGKKNKFELSLYLKNLNTDLKTNLNKFEFEIQQQWQDSKHAAI